MQATSEDLQLFLNKQKMGQSAAQKYLDEYIKLKAMAEEYDSPVIEHLRTKLEKEIKLHAKQVLENKEPDKDYALKCQCGIVHDMNRVYMTVYNEAWKTINRIIVEWYEKNTSIKKGARR